MTTLLDTLRHANALRTLDNALAQSLRRLDPETPDTVLAAAALASLAVASGHAGFDPAHPQRLVDADIDWPTPDAWRADLAASRWVSQPTAGDTESPADAPLVLEGAASGSGLLYLRRYREYERRLALGLRRLGSDTPAATDLTALAPLFAQLFPPSSPPHPNPSPARGEGLKPASPDPDALIPTLLPQAGEGLKAAADEGISSADDKDRPSPSESTSPARGRGRAEGAGEGALAPDLQSRAAATALRNNLVLVTGGPGTGKTITITRLLVLLAAQAHAAGKPMPRIALAAPTGRAAERMAESVRHAVQSLAANGVDAALLDALPVAGTTLHRLLGTIPDASTFRHHADNPLPFDVVVVDEASMIDLPLMAKLVDAVPTGARLVLLGDPDQLPSVEAGDVLSGILRAAGDGSTLAPDDADALAPLLGPPQTTTAVPTSPARGREPAPGLNRGRASGAGEGALPPDATQTPTFPGRHIHLQRGYRQSASLDLAPLAAAVRNGDTATALALLRGGTLAGVHFHEHTTDPLQAHRDQLLAHWSALADATEPADALALGNRLRILTAVREGPQGARGLNARIEALLSERHPGHAARRGGETGTGTNRYFHGRLLLVTENSYRHRLFNGDIGICLADDSGTVMAWFPGDDPRHPRPFHPAALPAHDSAFAMTVHKAQGSEFDAVWLVLPDRPNRVLSRELVYTGLTRARRELHVIGRVDVIADALARHAGRWSGLGWRLGADRTPSIAEAPAFDALTDQGALF